jgi:hypothetical protein
MKRIFAFAAAALTAAFATSAMAGADYVERVGIQTAPGYFTSGLMVRADNETFYVVPGEMGLTKNTVFDPKAAVAWADATFGTSTEARFQSGGWTDTNGNGIQDTDERNESGSW